MQHFLLSLAATIGELIKPPANPPAFSIYSSRLPKPVRGLSTTVCGIAKIGIFSTNFKRRTNVELCTIVQTKPFSPDFGNILLCVGFAFIKF
jgi:hypothetical protein